MSNGYGFLHDSCGNKSSKRLVALVGAVVGYGLALVVVIYGLNHEIQSSSVVIAIMETIVGAPFITLVSTVFEKRSKDV
jgi:hypothetical protein